MLARLAGLLNVRPQEGRLALLVGALFLAVQAGQALGDNAASAIFFLRYGVDFLPYMYMVLGVITFMATLLYTVGLGRFLQRRFFTGLLAGAMGMLLLERLALLSDLPIIYPLLWLSVSVLAMILGTFVWNVAAEVCDSRQAKRLFPLFASAGILGYVAGNLITGIFAQAIGTENLLVLYAVLLGMGLWLVRRVPLASVPPAAGKQARILADLRAGYDFVRASPLLRMVAFASILFSILYFSIAFPFSKVTAASFPDEAGVAGFLGLFSSITTVVTFLVSLLIANRVYARLGIVNSILLLPVTYIFGFAVFATTYTLPGAVAARFTQQVTLNGLAGTAWNALFNVAPPEKRGQVLAFNNGLPSQVGVILSGVLLILGESVLTTRQIFWMGIVVAVVCAAVVWRMRAAYGQALLAALQAGRVDVFDTEAGILERFRGDPAAVRVAAAALEAPQASTRRLAAEILARMGPAAADVPEVAPALTQRLSDPDAGVCQAAAAALGRLSVPGASAALAACLSHPEPAVRAEALHALGRLEAAASPKLLAKLGEMLDDPSGPVSAWAAAALARLGQPERGLVSLEEQFARQASSADRLVILAALQELARETALLQAAVLPPRLIETALGDEAAPVRAAACRLLGEWPGEHGTAKLLDSLFDRDPRVADAAAVALEAHWEQSRAQVLPVLSVDNPAAQEAALRAVPAGDLASLEAVLAFVQQEAANIRLLRAQAGALPAEGRALGLLRSLLAGQRVRRERLLVQAAGLYGSAAAMQVIGRSLNTRDPQARAAALEALETLGDRRFTGEILPLLEESAGLEPRAAYTTAQVLKDQMAGGDAWRCALAARAAGELGHRDLIPALRNLQEDENPLISQAAHEALAAFGEVTDVDTLQTVSQIERLLLLREVPLFADLPPEDLEDIAAVAGERLYADASEICREGEVGEAMYLIVNGQVQVLVAQPEGERLLAERGPGDFVGEMAVLEAEPRSATLRASGEVRLLVIEGQAVQAILRDRPSVSIAMLRGLSRRLRELSGEGG